jgi:hypothetical protein
LTIERKLVAVIVGALALVTAPVALATVDQFTDSWTDEPTEFFQPNACVKKQATGTGVESGTATVTITSNGSVHVRGETHGTITLYEALGPGPWDPQPGALIGTWTYEGRFSDQAPPNQAGALSGTAHGPFVLADGRTVMLMSEFHVTFDTAGNPPKLFFAHFACGGSGSFTG